MDPHLPAQLVQLLAPYLPYLLKGLKLAGQEAARRPGEKAGEGGFEQAKALWEKLRPKVEAKPAALEAAQDAATHPDDEDTLAALRLQLKKLLAEDESLAQELANTLAQSRPAGQEYAESAPDEGAPALQDFLRPSADRARQEQERRERTRRRILRVSVSAALLFLVVAALALWQTGEARRQRNLAQARQMAASGQMVFDGGAQGPVIATLLGSKPCSAVGYTCKPTNWCGAGCTFCPSRSPA
jgi:flagellar biosynthesis GTPase FlhF